MLYGIPTSYRTPQRAALFGAKLFAGGYAGQCHSKARRCGIDACVRDRVAMNTLSHDKRQREQSSLQPHTTVSHQRPTAPPPEAPDRPTVPTVPSYCRRARFRRLGVCPHTNGPDAPLASADRPGARISHHPRRGGGHVRRGRGGRMVPWCTRWVPHGGLYSRQGLELDSCVGTAGSRGSPRRELISSAPRCVEMGSRAF